MNDFIEFISFTNPTVQVVVLGTVLIAACAAMVGTYTYLRKRTLVGDAVAHAIFPGICLGFMISGSKNPLYLLIGAILVGWIALLLMDTLVAKTKLKTDTALAYILTFFFGIGSVLMSYIQKSGNASQSGLHDFLFGKAANMVLNDLYVFGITSIILFLLVIFFFKQFKLVSFNPEFAASIGLNVKAYTFLLTTMTVVAVSIGIQAVGVVLMSALLITPATTARLWTHKLHKLMLLAGFFGALAGVLGAYISFTASNMPTGPWFVVFLTAFAILSIFFAPKSGLISRYKLQLNNKRKINQENILKVTFQLKEQGLVAVTREDYIKKRGFVTRNLEIGIHRLKRKGLLEEKENQISLSEKGEIEAKRVVRLHRLWELYLTKRMNFKEDHIHGGAETIEHIITPELEKELLKELDYPTLDPHQSNIPY
ncbi:MAG: iron chelate uptake ABC transporter family permease subunit [Lishizhenia sp.]